MLDKLGGVFAPKPSPGPHKTRECLPLCLILRNRLKYALTYKEVTTILMQRLVKVDGKTRRDKCYPTGFMDVVSIDKTDEHFRIIYDAKGRFVVHRITALEAQVRPNAHAHLPGFFLEGASASSFALEAAGRERDARGGTRANEPPERAIARPTPSASAVARRRPQDERERSAAARPPRPPPHRPSLEP